MERLSPLDAAFIEAEDADRHTSMAIASIAVFEGPAPAYEEFVEAIESRLHLVRRYTQRVRVIPFHLGPPVWTDAPNFDVRYHVRETALPPPGTDAELAHLMARVMAERLDRDRPLWEDWMVTGLADGHWALLSKVHHCMVDGIAGTDLYRVMFDELSEGPGLTTGSVGSEETTSLGLALEAARNGALLPLRSLRATLGMLAHPGSGWRMVRETAHGSLTVGRSLSPAHRSSLSGPIGQQRRYTWVRASLSDVRAVKESLGGTINDVVLTAITAGFRALLMSRHEAPDPRLVPSLVPVSLRPPGKENIYDNEVSAMILHLPVHVADPQERLVAVRERLGELKGSGEAEAGHTLTTLAGYLFYNPWSAFVRTGFRIPQREIVTVTTNVPGPRQTLYCLGRPLIEIIPYVPIASTVRIGIAIFSYRDTITFGITGDYDSTPDLEVLARGIEDGMAELLKTSAAGGN